MNDFPFDVILGKNGDMSICLPVRPGDPDPDAATLARSAKGVTLTRRAGDSIELEIDEDTAKRLLSLDSVVIVETDMEAADISFMYAAQVAEKAA